MNRFVSSLVLSAIGFAGMAQAEKKTLDQHWEDVGLEFSLIESELSTKRCYKDQQYFTGCVYALNAMLGLEKKAYVLIPSDRANEPGFGETVTNLDAVRIVGAKKAAGENAIEMYESLKKERLVTNAAWAALFKKRDSVRVDFEKVIAHLKTLESFKAKEPIVTAAALNALYMVVKDPHTMFVPAEYVKQESTVGGDNFVGIGATMKTLQKNGRTVVMIQAPIEGGPAHKAGLKSNDIVLEVDGKDVTGLALGEVIGMIRGPKGKEVVLGIQRKTETLKVKIVRAEISFPNVVTKTLKTPDGDVGYVKLAGFMKPNGCEEVRDAVEAHDKAGVKALVFDLRENGGGLLTQSVCIANIFIDANQIVVSTKGLEAGATSRSLRTQNKRVTSLPLITLINSRSASASEIVSGALQDHKRAFLVGERTYGKGTVQNQVPVMQGKLVLRATTARFYLPSGRTNQIEGVFPDLTHYRVPNPTKEDMFATREEDEYMALPPVGQKWTQPRPQQVAELEKCVAAGSAKKAFADSAEAAIPADYQLLVAQDAALCTAKLNLTAQAPEFSEPEFTWDAPTASPLDTIRRRLENFLP